MFIVRWLLSHPLLLAWALAILTILLNFGSGSKDHAEHGDDAHAKQEHHHEDKAHAKSEGHSDKAHAEAPAAKPVVAEATPAAAAPTAEVAPTTEAAPAPEAEPVVTETATDPNVVVAAPQAPAAVPAENLLMMARNAYWQGDFAASTQYYNQLIKQAPDEISHQGELANVLWKNNKPKEAAALYADIAIPMIEAGKRNEVMNLVGFIGVYFPEKAQAISAALNK